MQEVDRLLLKHLDKFVKNIKVLLQNDHYYDFVLVVVLSMTEARKSLKAEALCFLVMCSLFLCTKSKICWNLEG